MSETKTTRRDFIRILGSASVVFAAGGAVSACSAVPERASAPWRQAGKNYQDVRLQALSYAILAPNPHNRQPWIVDLATPNQIMLYCDRTRLLPDTDPYSRQILIGHGCFLELMSIAAGQSGYRADILPFPEGVFPATHLDDRPVARITLTQDGSLTPDPLFRQIPHRRSNKEPYDTRRPVTNETLNRLQDAQLDQKATRLGTTRDPSKVGRLRDIIWQGMEIEMKTPRTYLESVRLMRIGKDEIAANPDGIDLGGTMIEIGKLLGMVTREKLADPNSSAFQQGLDMQKELADSAMAFGWLTTPGNRRRDQLAAGRAYARINLKATELGLAIHPWSQVLQEYPEMKSLQKRFFDFAGQGREGRIQMLFRMGYGEQVPPSPRHPLESLVRG